MNYRLPKLFQTFLMGLEFIGLAGLYFLCTYLVTGEIATILTTECLLECCLIMLIRSLLIKLLTPYKEVQRQGINKELKNVLKFDTLQIGIYIIAIYLLDNEIFLPGLSLFIFYALEIMLDFSVRCGIKFYLKKYYKQSNTSQKILLITTKGNAEHIIRTMHDNDEWFYEICGCVILDKDMMGDSILNTPVVANREQIFDYITYNVVDAVFLDGYIKREEYNELLDFLDQIGCMIYIDMTSFDVKLYNERVIRIGGFTTIASSLREITPTQSIAKHILDIIGGLVGSLLTLLLLLVIGPLIKLNSTGPIFFSQKRVGKNGRIFKIYKFRTMYVDAEERKAELMKDNKMNGLMFKMEHDPRITSIGKFLRKTSLDEFPQFFNVLKGEMSLVGTRPPTVNEFEQYHAHHKKRLSMKPGITGLWQISGRNEITDFEEVVKLDGEYIDRWNIGMDIKILLKTLVVVFRGKGAE